MADKLPRLYRPVIAMVIAGAGTLLVVGVWWPTSLGLVCRWTCLMLFGALVVAYGFGTKARLNSLARPQAGAERNDRALRVAAVLVFLLGSAPLAAFGAMAMLPWQSWPAMVAVANWLGLVFAAYLWRAVAHGHAAARLLGEPQYEAQRRVWLARAAVLEAFSAPAATAIAVWFSATFGGITP